jgi:hypothetical protein
MILTLLCLLAFFLWLAYVRHNARTQRHGPMSEDGFLRRIARALGSAPEPAAPPPPAAPPRPAMDYADNRIPTGAKERIARILSTLTEVEAAMAREPIPGITAIDLVQLRDQHLPTLVKSYIDIPPAHRSEIFRKTGKSASFILDEGLDQMQRRVDDIMRNLAQQDIDAFTNNTRFIGERYAGNNPFD